MIVTISWQGSNNRQQRFDLMENALYKSNYYKAINNSVQYYIQIINWIISRFIQRKILQPY